jgi:MFS family permease
MQVALLVGYLADTRERRALFVGVVLLGEVPCLLTYWVTQYWQLLLLRCLTGISIGGTLSLPFPTTHLFPPPVSNRLFDHCSIIALKCRTECDCRWG